MNQTTTLPGAQEETPETVAAIKAELERYAVEWEGIKERMRQDQREIDFLKAQTRAKLDSLEEQMKQLRNR